MNEKYERLTVTASDGSVGIRRGYSKDDLIARLVELEDGIEHNRIAILPYNEGSFVNYGDEKAVICGYVIQNNQLYIQLDAYERPNEKYRYFWIVIIDDYHHEDTFRGRCEQFSQHPCRCAPQHGT